MRYSLIVVLSIVSLLLLVSCGECKQALDCPSRLPGFEASCVDKTCEYLSISNVCGNGVCDITENECTCEQDCGTCSGKVPGSMFLAKQCINNACLADVAGSQEQVFDSGEARSTGGDRFRVESLYTSPFNTKKDTFKVTLTLSTQGKDNREQLIKSIELTGRTKERSVISIAQKDISKHLWSSGSSFVEELIIDVPGSVESELDNLQLIFNYDYLLKGVQKSAGFKQNLKTKLLYVKPDVTYPCSECDDGNPGTNDVCSPETNFFCSYEPIPGACGNFVCDGNENKCRCPQDCGPCEGSAGEYVDFTCRSNNCITTMKSNVVQTPNSIFDERRVGPVELNNNYEFNSPFDINNDKFMIEIGIYSMGDASDFKVETIRLLLAGLLSRNLKE